MATYLDSKEGKSAERWIFYGIAIYMDEKFNEFEYVYKDNF